MKWLHNSRIAFVLSFCGTLLGQANAQSPEIPPCVSNLPATISEMKKQKNWLSDSQILCEAETGAWTIKAHSQLSVNFLTSGKSLTLLYFSGNGRVDSLTGLPFPVVLRPITNQVWQFEELIDGKSVKWGKSIYYYAWKPTQEPLSRTLDWGDQDLRMFRCSEEEEFSCITYFDLRKCSIADMQGLHPQGKPGLHQEVILSIRKTVPTPGPEILDDFGAVELLTRQLALALADIRCSQGLE